MIKSITQTEWTLKKINGTKWWKVDEEYTWSIYFTDWTIGKIKAEKGFITNMWSIPKLFRLFFDPTEFTSYIAHDVIYTYHTIEFDGEQQQITQEEADEFLLEALYEEWCWISRHFIFIALRLFGFLSW
jgi:hypothetical protein